MKPPVSWKVLCVNDCDQAVLRGQGNEESKRGCIVAGDSWRCPRPLKNRGPETLFNCGWENQQS